MKKTNTKSKISIFNWKNVIFDSKDSDVVILQAEQLDNGMMLIEHISKSIYDGQVENVMNKIEREQKMIRNIINSSDNRNLSALDALNNMGVRE